MTHAEFVDAYSRGRLQVTVDRSLANRLMDTEFVPKSYLVAQQLWTLVWTLSLGLGGFLSTWWQWWPGLLFVALGIVVLLRKSRIECALVIRHALKDERFYRLVVEQQILEFPEQMGESR